MTSARVGRAWRAHVCRAACRVPCCRDRAVIAGPCLRGCRMHAARSRFGNDAAARACLVLQRTRQGVHDERVTTSGRSAVMASLDWQACDECGLSWDACQCACVVCGGPRVGDDAGHYQIEPGRWIPTCSDQCDGDAELDAQMMDAESPRDRAARVLSQFDVYDEEFRRYSADPDVREKYIDEARFACEEMAWELAEVLRAMLDAGE